MATNELYHFVLGTVDTPEKFEAEKPKLAQHVWETMKSTDSRECRNCHHIGFNGPREAVPSGPKRHKAAMEQGKTSSIATRASRTIFQKVTKKNRTNSLPSRRGPRSCAGRFWGWANAQPIGLGRLRRLQLLLDVIPVDQVIDEGFEGSAARCGSR